MQHPNLNNNYSQGSYLIPFQPPDFKCRLIKFTPQAYLQLLTMNIPAVRSRTGLYFFLNSTKEINLDEFPGAVDSFFSPNLLQTAIFNLFTFTQIDIQNTFRVADVCSPFAWSPSTTHLNSTHIIPPCTIIETSCILLPTGHLLLSFCFSHFASTYFSSVQSNLLQICHFSDPIFHIHNSPIEFLERKNQKTYVQTKHESPTSQRQSQTKLSYQNPFLVQTSPEKSHNSTTTPTITKTTVDQPVIPFGSKLPPSIQPPSITSSNIPNIPKVPENFAPTSLLSSQTSKSPLTIPQIPHITRHQPNTNNTLSAPISYSPSSPFIKSPSSSFPTLNSLNFSTIGLPFVSHQQNSTNPNPNTNLHSPTAKLDSSSESLHVKSPTFHSATDDLSLMITQLILIINSPLNYDPFTPRLLQSKFKKNSTNNLKNSKFLLESCLFNSQLISLFTDPNAFKQHQTKFKTHNIIPSTPLASIFCPRSIKEFIQEYFKSPTAFMMSSEQNKNINNTSGFSHNDNKTKKSILPELILTKSLSQNNSGHTHPGNPGHQSQHNHHMNTPYAFNPGYSIRGTRPFHSTTSKPIGSSGPPAGNVGNVVLYDQIVVPVFTLSSWLTLGYSPLHCIKDVEYCVLGDPQHSHLFVQLDQLWNSMGLGTHTPHKDVSLAQFQMGSSHGFFTTDLLKNLQERFKFSKKLSLFKSHSLVIYILIDNPFDISLHPLYSFHLLQNGSNLTNHPRLFIFPLSISQFYSMEALALHIHSHIRLDSTVKLSVSSKFLNRCTNPTQSGSKPYRSKALLNSSGPSGPSNSILSQLSDLESTSPKSKSPEIEYSYRLWNWRPVTALSVVSPPLLLLVYYNAQGKLLYLLFFSADGNIYDWNIIQGSDSSENVALYIKSWIEFNPGNSLNIFYYGMGSSDIFIMKSALDQIFTEFKSSKPDFSIFTFQFSIIKSSFIPKQDGFTDTPAINKSESPFIFSHHGIVTIQYLNFSLLFWPEQTLSVLGDENTSKIGPSDFPKIPQTKLDFLASCLFNLGFLPITFSDWNHFFSLPFLKIPRIPSFFRIFIEIISLAKKIS